MTHLPHKLLNQITQRVEENTLRTLERKSYKVDFYSNDYLGFSKDVSLLDKVDSIVRTQDLKLGSGGSRLLSGNHQLYSEAEALLKNLYKSEGVLIFNSGYNANIGLISSVASRGDVILYDQYIHASIREGITLSNAKSYKFTHNSLESLKAATNRPNVANVEGEIYVVVESVYSMDGDSPNLVAFSEFCKKNKFHLIVDEAHAVGIFGHGFGLVSQLDLENKIFARVVTFGKALGCHGAAVLGGEMLRTYLINFSKSIIYTTALPPHSIASIIASHRALEKTSEMKKLFQNIKNFKQESKKVGLSSYFIESISAIQSFISPTNIDIQKIEEELQSLGFGVRAIRPPTVPHGGERLRFCIHSYNTLEEIIGLLDALKGIVG